MKKTKTTSRSTRTKPSGSSGAPPVPPPIPPSTDQGSDVDELPPPTNLKHLAFIDEYLIDLNGAQAAIRAGYSRKSARIQACQLLTNPNIAAEVARRFAARAAKAQAEGEMPLDFLLRTMRADQPVHQSGESPIAFMARFKAWQEDRLKAAIAAAPYTHNRLTAVEHSNKDGKPLQHKVEVEFV